MSESAAARQDLSDDASGTRTLEAGVPLTAYAVEDVEKEHERLKGLGVVFRTEPTKTAGPMIAVFERASWGCRGRA